jgi:hypothetical protein
MERGGSNHYKEDPQITQIFTDSEEDRATRRHKKLKMKSKLEARFLFKATLVRREILF